MILATQGSEKEGREQKIPLSQQSLQKGEIYSWAHNWIIKIYKTNYVNNKMEVIIFLEMETKVAQMRINFPLPCLVSYVSKYFDHVMLVPRGTLLMSLLVL